MARKRATAKDGSPSVEDVRQAIHWGLGNGMMDCNTAQRENAWGEQEEYAETGAAGDADYWWGGAYMSRMPGTLVVEAADGSLFTVTIRKTKMKAADATQ